MSPRRILVDYSAIGHARRFTVRLLRHEREGLTIGDEVVLEGDAVPPRRAVVTTMSADGRDVELTLDDLA